MMRILILLLLLCFLLPGAARAESHATVSGALDVSALQAGHAAQLAVILDIAPGYHAQSHAPLDEYAIKCMLKMDAVPGIEFGQIIYPAGQVEDYPQLGKLSVYTRQAVIIVPITITKDAMLGSIKLSGKVRMQICDNEVCFPPEDDAFSVSIEVVSRKSPIEPRNQELFPRNPTTKPEKSLAAPATQHSDSGTNPYSPLRIDTKNHSPAGALAAAPLAGPIFNWIPCALPVLPLKAALVD